MVDKAAKDVMSHSRIIVNVGGPKLSRRSLDDSWSDSLLYAAQVWADSLSRKTYKKTLVQCHSTIFESSVSYDFRIITESWSLTV